MRSKSGEGIQGRERTAAARCHRPLLRLQPLRLPPLRLLRLLLLLLRLLLRVMLLRQRLLWWR